MGRHFVFDCPECAIETAVDADIRAELLDDGCLFCQTTVTPDAFSEPVEG